MLKGWDLLVRTVEGERDALDLLIGAWLQRRQTTGKRIYCAAGCSNCCTLFVQSTLAEALLVAERINADQFKRLEDYVLRQKEAVAGETELLTILHKDRFTIGPCPFLDQSGSCSIYAERPLACRALLSTKDPAWCAVDFSTLNPLEKRLYLESLERPVVAYPVHYVAETQEAAEEAEERILTVMQSCFGVAVSGNFPLLVYLAHTLDLPTQIRTGTLNWQSQLNHHLLSHPLLLKR